MPETNPFSLELEVKAMLAEHPLRSILDELVCACDRKAEERMPESPQVGTQWLAAAKEVHRALVRLDALKLDL